MKWLKDSGRKPQADDAAVIMSNAVNFSELAFIFGKSLPNHLLQELNADLVFELQTIELYEDTIPTLIELKSQGLKLALCSNLAKPYGEKLKTLLTYSDVSILSYEVGGIKPQPKIYQSLIDHLGCKMSDVLFIGDHPILDVEVPTSIEMSARLIDRKKQQKIRDVLSDLI